MSPDWPAFERDLASDEPARVKAAATALGALDDDRARTLLAGALARPPGPASLAALALASHGEAAVAHALAALEDPSRRVAAAMALGRIGSPTSRRHLRALADDAEAMVRVSAAIGLYRAGDRDPAFWSPWIAREPHIAVLGFLAAVAGSVAIDDAARTGLDAQAAEGSTPADVRANCVWAIAAHDADRGLALAEGLDDDGGAALAAIVARRGGPLAGAWGGGDPAADRTADTLGIAGVASAPM